MSMPPDAGDEVAPTAAPPPPAPPAPPPSSMPVAPPAVYAPPSVPAGMWFDAQSGLALPEGVQLASIGRRIGSGFLAIPLAIVTLGIGYVIWGLILWPRGQTPAKAVLGLCCWRPEQGKKATFWFMALREVVGSMVQGILSLVTEVISFVLMVSGRERKCLKDHVAGTVVLYDPNKILTPTT